MSNTDPTEWRLYDTDLTTQLAILPFQTSHIYTELNEPGSGEITIPLDAAAGASVGIGKFCALYYRGSFRVGFFIDNLKYTDADPNEGAGRTVNMSGRGALALLDGSVIWSADGLATTRTFTSVTKASILKTLIDEAQARGELATLTYSFTATVDSAAVAWTDSENYDLAVGTSLLDVARQFASTGGFEYTLDFSAGTFNLGAYSAGRGANIASTTYFRIGEQCEEVGRDTRGDEIFNYYLVKWKDGYVAVSDATSITTYGIRSKFLSLEQAQSSASATTYASAKLALTKDPRSNKTVKVYDGIKPRLFVDYDLGDTVSLDRFGTVTTDVIKGIQADFDGTEFSHVVIDFNFIMYDNEMKLSSQLDWLSNQWNTAHDGDLLEVSQGMSIGGANGSVNAIHTYGDYVYIGGAFTLVGNIASNYTAQYQISTHTWTALTGIPASVTKIVDVGGTVYACTAFKVYVLSGTAWTLIGTVPSATDLILCMESDGTSLYVGGVISLMDAVAITGQLAKYNGGTWTSPVTTVTTYGLLSLCYFAGNLYGGFAGSTGGNSALRWALGTAWVNVKGATTPNLSGKYIFALKEVGSNMIIASNDNNGGSASTCRIYLWDGVDIGTGSELVLLGTISDFLPVNNSVSSGSCSFGKYLTDIYFGADFDTIDGVTGFAGIAKYSGGLWSPVGGGVSTAAGDGVTALELIDSDVYAGGKFTSAFGIVTNNLSLFVTDFQSMLDHALNDYGGIDHERLSGLLGGTTSQHYHLTSAEYTGTGSNEFVRKTTPTLVTPVLGVATATSINKVAITAPATSATLTIANGKTLTVSETLTITGAASGYTLTIPATGTAALLGTANVFTDNQAITATHTLAIGVTGSAEATVDIRGDAETSYWATTYSATLSSQEVFRRSRGTQGSEAAIQLNDSIGSFSFRGYDGSAFTASRAIIQVLANENWDSTHHGTRLLISTTPNAGTAVVERVRFASTEFVVNETGVAYDFRVESDTNANMIFVNGTNNQIGLGTGTILGDITLGLTTAITSGKNLGVGTNTFGTSATNTLALFNGTVPSTSPADTVQLFSVDLSAGNATLGIRTETAVVTESVVSDRTLSVKINGTTYKICLKA